MQEQAPVHGFGGISEGATVALILLVQHALGRATLGVGLEATTLLSVCALTSPAHAELYGEVGVMSASSSIHLVGNADTRAIQHMVGRNAALFGAGAGVRYFAGGHKLPKLDDSLTLDRHLFVRGSLGFARASSLPCDSALEERTRDRHATPRVSCSRARAALDIPTKRNDHFDAGRKTCRSRAHWQESGVLSVTSPLTFSITLLRAVLESISCYALILSGSLETICRA